MFRARRGSRLAARVLDHGAQGAEQLGLVAERSELAVGERRQPGVVGEQGEQAAQMDVVEAADAGHRVAGWQRREHLRGLEQRPVGRGQPADGGAGRDDGGNPGRDLLGPAVRVAYGVRAGRQRDERPDLVVEDRDQGRRPRHLGRPQARRDQVVEQRGARGPQREADVRAPGRQPGDRGPPVRLGVGGVGQQADQELVVHTAQVAVAGAVVQPVHGQRGGGPLGHGGQAGRGGGGRADDQSAPVALRPADPGDQPAVAGVPLRASRRADVARAPFPVVEEAPVDGRVRRARDVVDDPVLRALEDHGAPRRAAAPRPGSRPVRPR